MFYSIPKNTPRVKGVGEDFAEKCRCTLLAKIKNILEDNRREKIIIFSFFRNTVRYLYERLSAANVSATYIMGGVDMDEKQRRLAEFEDCDINVLVSSEVGSEGIDLQFARYELNYDLPWNPMRLEQRIGRIDRIGQKSSDIYICNAYCENTISDRILRRLYERIEEFRNVIGDLEEVMGEQVKNLEVDVFREHRELTDDDVKERAEQCVNAICHQRQITKSLELQAGNMASPHQEFILRNINKSYEAKRLITPDELMFFCRDILQEMYQGSSVACVGAANIADVRLSDAARREFTRFLTNTSMAYGTQLNSCPKGLRCGFGRKYSPSQCDEHVVEVVDVNHPLVRWLLSVVERNTIYTSGCEVVEVKRSKLPCDVKIEVGCYAYLIQHWESDGVRNINELRYCICRGIHDEVQEPVIIDGYDAERIMMSVVVDGSPYDVTLLQDEDFNACGIAMEHVDKHMEDDFCNFEELQKVRNSNLIEEQSRYIERTAAVKSSRIRAVVEKMRMELSQGLIQESAAGRHEGLIKANEKRIENIIAKRDERIARIEDKLDCNPTIEDVALGILFVTEG